MKFKPFTIGVFMLSGLFCYSLAIANQVSKL